MTSISSLIRDAFPPPPPAPEPPQIDADTIAPELAEALANAPTLVDAVDPPTVGGPHPIDPDVLPPGLFDNAPVLVNGNVDPPTVGGPHPIDPDALPPDFFEGAPTLVDGTRPDSQWTGPYMVDPNLLPPDFFDRGPLDGSILDGVDIDPADLERLARPDETPFVRGDGDRHTVDPNDIKQNRYGSCAVLSTLHTIAQHDPATIQNMIQDNGDGTYTVTFKEKVEVFGHTVGWKDVEVTVSGPFDGGAAHPGDTVEQGQEVWPAIIEKAYAQQYKNGDMTYTEGVMPADVMEHILGEKADTVETGQLTSAQMSEKLANGEAVVAWTPGFTDENGNSTVTPEQQALIDHYQIAGGHAYAVSEVIPAGTSYTDPNTGEKVTATEDVIVLDNPWGHADVMMPYSDYQKVYGWVSSAPTN